MGIDNLFAASTPTVPDIDLGMYDATLSAIQTTYIVGGQYGEGFVVEDDNGNKVNRFRWVFQLLDESGAELYDEGDALQVDCVTGLQFFAKAKNPSRQTRIMQALLTKAEREAWEDGEGAPTMAELIGRKCQVQVDENAKGYPTAANILPPRARRSTGRKAAAAAVAEVDSEDEE